MITKNNFQTSAGPYHRKSSPGFTLLEMLLVIAMIAILAGIVIFAINPGKQLASARNAERRSDVNTIINAVYQYAIDNNGTLPTNITTDNQDICAISALTGSCAGMVDLGVLIENQKYLPQFPRDPDPGCAANNTCYQISRSANGRVTVSASYAELDASISVTK